jgi:hypothetical protein
MWAQLGISRDVSTEASAGSTVSRNILIELDFVRVILRAFRLVFVTTRPSPTLLADVKSRPTAD